ncbi:MAG: TolC family protein [Planctomycetota bacterium]
MSFGITPRSTPPRSTLGLAALLFCLLFCAAGCQLYQPEPLDAPQHEAEWRRRSNEEDLRELARNISPPALSSAPAPGGIDLATGEALALWFNPALRSAAAYTSISAVEAEGAGQWDDPVLSGDVLRLVEHVDDRWSMGGTLGLRLPINGRLGVQRDGAEARARTETFRFAVLAATTRAQLRSTWVEWSAADRQAQLLEELLMRIGEILRIVERLEQAGSISRLEARLFQLERATRTSDLLLVRGRAEEKRQTALALLGLRPECTLELAPTVALAAPILPADPFTWLWDHSPVLAAERAAYEASEQELRLEIRRQYPDLELGPAFEREEGVDGFGLGFSLPIPLWNRNAPAIAVARARRAAARVAFEAEHERLLGEVHRARAQHAAAQASRLQIEQALLPLAEAQLDDVRRRTELGELDTLLTLESVVRAHEVRVRWLEASVAESLAASRLQELLDSPATPGTSYSATLVPSPIGRATSGDPELPSATPAAPPKLAPASQDSPHPSPQEGSENERDS